MLTSRFRIAGINGAWVIIVTRSTQSLEQHQQLHNYHILVDGVAELVSIARPYKALVVISAGLSNEFASYRKLGHNKDTVLISRPESDSRYVPETGSQLSSVQGSLSLQILDTFTHL